MKTSKPGGFTLLEVVVVIGVIVITLPTLFAIIFNVVQEQAKLYRLNEVKKQGDNILTSIENQVRANAVAAFDEIPPAAPVCTTLTPNSTNISQKYFLDKTDSNLNWFGYEWDPAHKVVYVNTVNGIENDVDLNNSKVLIDNFSISCVRSQEFSPPLLTVSFEICYNNNANPNQDASCSSTRQEELADLNYQTTVKLRNE